MPLLTAVLAFLSLLLLIPKLRTKPPVKVGDSKYKDKMSKGEAHILRELERRARRQAKLAPPKAAIS